MIVWYSHAVQRFLKQAEIEPRIQRVCHRNVADPQLIIDLTEQLS